MSEVYLVHKDELYHHGVKGMKWGHRKKYPESVSNARAAYKSAKKEYNRAYNKAYNYSSTHAISQYTNKKRRAESDRRWGDAYDKAKTANDAKTAYKQAKKEYKQSDEYKQQAARRKKTLKVGAAAAGTMLAAYGSYKVSKVMKEKAFESAYERANSFSKRYVARQNLVRVESAFRNGNIDRARKEVDSIVDLSRKLSKADKDYANRASRNIIAAGKELVGKNGEISAARYINMGVSKEKVLQHY